ncbi:MAG: manganese efflux pump MntP family protein [Bilophila sp.]
MSFLELFALAVALAMDAFAVAVCTGCTLQRVTLGHFVRLSLAFGFFQFLMPIVGWYLGLSVRGLIEAWDHWIAFALLAWIGGNMIRSALTPQSSCKTATDDPTRGRKLIILAVATSIDALAVGLSFSMLHLTIWGPALLIGVVCASITAGGLLAGKLLAKADLFGRWAELLGGCVLLAIGLKILYEHGMFRFYA